MGVLGVWYNNFFGAQSHALLPYDQVLANVKFLTQRLLEHNYYCLFSVLTPVCSLLPAGWCCIMLV